MSNQIIVVSIHGINRWSKRYRISVLRCFLRPIILVILLLQTSCKGQRIAIVTGRHRQQQDQVVTPITSITATFVAKYLTDYLHPSHCTTTSSLQSLTLLDPNFSPKLYGDNENNDSSNNGPSSHQRMAFHVFGSQDELSATVHPLVTEMAKDGNLTLIPSPLDPTNTVNNQSILLLHHGNGKIVTVETTLESISNDFFWRYSIDYLVVSRLASKVQTKWDALHQQMMIQKRTTIEESLLDSPAAIWNQVGLGGLVRTPLDVFLAKYRVNEDLAWWRKYFLSTFWIPQQGSFRQEALSAMLLQHYHQNASQVNSLLGLLTFLLATDQNRYTVKGGMEQLIQSAWKQAQDVYTAKCPNNSATVISHMPLEVVTIVGSVSGFDLYQQHGEYIGTFDQVILADSLTSCQIQFLIKSHVDETAVLQQMPLGGLIDNSGDSGIVIHPDHDGHDPLPRPLPAAVTRPFVQIVTTLVQKATLQGDYWSSKTGAMTTDWIPPREILITSQGMINEFNITGIVRVDDGMYEITSAQPLSTYILKLLFGQEVDVMSVTHQELAPDYRGEGVSINFLLYDGATGFHGHTGAGALYYPRAMELTVSTIETQAIGAKAVARMVADRLDWLETIRSSYADDEL
jgi:hypothetical protein